jgi:glucose/arabinose dehydrogenase
MRKLFMLLALLASVLSCKTRPTAEVVAAKENSASKKPVVETVATGLSVPWSLVFTPDKRLLIAERGGSIRVVENNILKEKPLAVITDVMSNEESGLLGMTIHPNFTQNSWIYICYTREKDKLLQEVIKRFRETPSGLVDEKIILDGIPAAAYHDGCRLKFGPDRKLYITTGDASKGELAQKLDSLAGKTLRLNDDGSIPTDNPFVSQKNARAEIWSYGHRNAQGLDWQPGTNLMFQTEHGPSGFDGPGGGDEVNIVERGKNYGWPRIHHTMTQKNLEQPLLEYTPAIAPAGATFYKSNAIAPWHNNFFFACLRGQRLIRVVLDGRHVVSTEDLFHNSYGRIRDIIEGPDGALYFSTSNRDGRGKPSADDDRVMRIRY